MAGLVLALVAVLGVAAWHSSKQCVDLNGLQGKSEAGEVEWLGWVMEFLMVVFLIVSFVSVVFWVVLSSQLFFPSTFGKDYAKRLIVLVLGFKPQARKGLKLVGLCIF